MLAAETENRVKAEGDTAVNPYPAKTLSGRQRSDFEGESHKTIYV
jgi:hypothetical protein